MTKVHQRDRMKTYDGSKSLKRSMIDAQGREITYLRLSVTDRCDLRCRYCMSDTMRFMPSSDRLNVDELDQLAAAFIRRGIRTIRVTGGEPLLRKGILSLLTRLGNRLERGELDELTLTTNGTQLGRFASRIAAAGIRRINVSLDHLHPDQFEFITRGGDITQVIDGLRAAADAGLHVKINVVAIRDFNVDHIADLMLWAHGQGYDLSVIESMPMGDVGEDRGLMFANVQDVKDRLTERFTLTPSPHQTSGPSRYFDVDETGGRVGFISPLSDHFCASCNRVRLTCSGRLHPCLGDDGSVDLRAVMRTGDDLDMAIDRALRRKPLRHTFDVLQPGQLSSARHMSVTGG